MSNQKVRLGFVGVGGMGQMAHLRNYITVPDCEVVAIAEVKPELGRRVAERYGVPKVYTSSAEMIEHEQPDGLVAIQPYWQHGQIISPLYQAGIPILTEKPLAASIEVAEKMLQALATGTSWHMVGYHKRSDPATMAAKREIGRLKTTGELGALRYVRIIMPAGDWMANGFSELIRSDEPLPVPVSDPPASDMDSDTFKAYSAFVNYYIHQVNLMRHLLGEPYRVTYADPSGVVLAVQSASGVAGVIEMSPYQTSVDWQESALVAFEHGYIKLDLPAPLAYNRPGRVEFLRDPGNGVTPEITSPLLPPIHAMRQQAMNFVGAIKGQNAPPCDAIEALEDLRVAREYLRLWKHV